MIDLNELKRQCVEIQNKRIANGAKLESGILKHLATEVVEAATAQEYLKYNKMLENSLEFESNVFEALNDYAEELADIIICVLIAAANDNIDIEKAIVEKIEKNRQRAELQGDKL